MKSCDIHIKMIDPGELGDLGLSCRVKIEEADVADKLMLMHVMAVNLHLDKADLIVYLKSELENIFDKGSAIITVPGGLNRES